MLTGKDISSSLRALSAAKGRTFLTMLGIIIGVTSVIAVTSIGLSAEQLIVGQVSSLGSNLVAVVAGGSDDEGPPAIAFGIIETTLKRDDIQALKDIPHVVAVSSYVRSTETVSYSGESISTTIQGSDHTMPLIEEMEIDEGRFFSDREVAQFSRVAVLGKEVERKLFPYGHSIGQLIRVKDVTFQVIGTVEERGSAFFQNQDDMIMVPVTTAQRMVQGIDYVNAGRMKVEDEAYIENVKAYAERIMLKRHDIDDPDKADFTIQSTDVAIDVFSSVTGAIQGFLLAVTAISLLVGGINIMNVMFVAVRERTREIGLRKAVGAKSKRILAQFVVESAIISLMGGVIGIVFGILLSWAISSIIAHLGYDWTFIMPIAGIWQSTLIAVTIGIIFGIYPAWKASKADAIDALRYE